MSLHPDFPEPTASTHSWDQPDPISDILSALDAATLTGETLAIEDLACVELYDITSHGVKWKPGGDSIGTELQMTLLGTLTDGRWFTLEAWNDYTGWGCQDGADVHIADTREAAIRDGLTTEGRNALGVEVTA